MKSTDTALGYVYPVLGYEDIKARRDPATIAGIFVLQLKADWLKKYRGILVAISIEG